MIARAFDFTKNPKLEKLLNGNFSDYRSQSEADMAFCSQLAGLGLGAEDIDHMVRLSGLHRSKWDELHGSRTYGQMTIQAVLASPPSIITVGSDGAWSDALLRNDNGAPKALLANILMVLANDSKYQDLVAYDEFSGDIILQRPAAWLPNIAVGSPWNDTCDSLLTAELQKDYGFALQTRIAAEGLSAIAHQRSFHPVRDYLRSCVGDDKPRLNSWLPIYLGCEASPYTAAVGRCWLISGVARIMRPGVKADSVLGLIGPQGILKSTALEVLASEPWFTDHISPLGEKDSRLDLLGTWIVELAELDRVRGADLARVKNFLSTKVDKYRVPYGHRKQPFPRSCIFASTSNIGDMLCDETGNRRWWPVEVGVLAPIDIEALRRDKDLLWAEALRCYEAGEHWWLDSAELIKAATEQTEKHYESGTWDEQILNWCAQPKARFKRLEDHCIAEDLPMDSSYGRVTLADVLIHAVGKTLAQITPGDRMQARKCLVHAGWRHSGKPERVGRDQHLVRFYYRPTPGGSQ
jgi:putative DNA primase/helicase